MSGRATEKLLQDDFSSLRGGGEHILRVFFSTRIPLKSSKCQPISKVRHFDIIEQYLVRDGLPYLKDHYYICQGYENAAARGRRWPWG